MERIAPLFLALAILVGPAGTESSGASDVARGHTTTIRAVARHYSSPHWDPKRSRVAQDTKVIWQNPTGIDHTVTSYGHGWTKDTPLSPGDSTSFTFRHRGTFKFRCMIHSTLLNGVCSGMCGKVIVQ
jgi:plastocyanin